MIDRDNWILLFLEKQEKLKYILSVWAKEWKLLESEKLKVAPKSKLAVRSLSTSMARKDRENALATSLMARVLKTARRPRKNKQSMASQFRNIPRENLYWLSSRPLRPSLVSEGQVFMRTDNVIRVTSHLSETRSSHVLKKQECLKRQSSLVNSFLLYFIWLKKC